MALACSPYLRFTSTEQIVDVRVVAERPFSTEWAVNHTSRRKSPANAADANCRATLDTAACAWTESSRLHSGRALFHGDEFVPETRAEHQAIQNAKRRQVRLW